MAKRAAGAKIEQEKVSLLVRLQAWYYGAGHAAVFSRYHGNNILRHAWNEWRGAAVLAFAIVSVYWNHATTAYGNECLEVVELNRQKFYRRDFEPDYDPKTPQVVHDSSMDYVYKDKEVGLKVNVDASMTVPAGPREDVYSRVNQTKVTPSMLDKARELNQETQGRRW